MTTRQPTHTSTTAGRPATAAQGVQNVASGADPDPQRRYAVPSASLLRVLRVLAALACLVAGVVGARVLSDTSGSLTAIDNGNQQVLRLHQIKGDVLRADGAATNGLAQGASDPTGQDADYRAVLAEAAKLTVDASEAQPLDQTQLASVNASLVNYMLSMERARTAYPTNNATGLTAATAAGTTLRGETVPALDKLIAADQDRVDTPRATDRLWTVGLALVPVLLLLGISIWLARRTRRVLNIGLVLALAASVLLWRLVDTSLTGASATMDAARAGSLQKATAAANAYSALADARSVEGRELLQPTTAATAETAWTTAMASVDAAVKTLGNAGVTSAVATYKTAHNATATQLKANKVTEARAGAASTEASALNPAYTSAANALTQAFNDSKQATATDVSNQRTNLDFGFALALLLGAVGALASWIGIGQRLREYR